MMPEDSLSSRSLPCQRVIEENTILYVPNVEDRVLLTAPLIQHFSNSIYSNGKLSIKQGGQRVFFIVNEDEDVTNTTEDLRRVLTQNVCGVGREFELEPEPNKLQQCVEVVENNQVLVLVGETFLWLIKKDVLNFNNISLLICDECHYAAHNCHPLNKIVRALRSSGYSHTPRVLALTTTLINRCFKTETCLKQVITLMEIFLARVTCSSDEDLTRLYASNPKEQGICCENNKIDEELSRLLRLIHSMISFLPGVPKATDKFNNGLLNKTENLLKNILECTQELGIKGGSIATLMAIKDLTMLIRSTDNLYHKTFLGAVLTHLYKFRKVADGFIAHAVASTNNDTAKYDKLISPKLKELLKTLKGTQPKQLVIVFVKKPFVMIALHYILQELSSTDAAFGHIKSNFFDGPDVDSNCERELYFLNHSSEKVLSQFDGDIFNVALACNMAERSIDSKLCDFVISFDPPDDFTEYIQTKSWCRNSSSKYIMIVEKGDKAIQKTYNMYRSIREKLKKTLLNDDGRMLSFPRKIVEKPFPGESAGCSSMPSVPKGSYRILKRYYNSLNYNDRYFKYAEYWYFIKVSERFKCFLKMPRESTCSDVEGDWCLDLCGAKKSVEVEACKALHAKGKVSGPTFEPESSLDRIRLTVARLTPTREEDCSSDQADKEEDKDSFGRLFIRHLCEKMLPDCLMGCQPKPERDVFLHVMHVNPLFQPAPENHRHFEYHQVLSSPHSFAIISSKKLPELAKFPLFLNAGKVEMELKTGQKISLNEQEIKLLKNFHFRLFDKLLGVAKPFLLMNLDMSLANYLIVPVKLGSDGAQMASVDWETVAEMDEPFVAGACGEEAVPPDRERLALQVTDDSHLRRLVSVWYRPKPAQKYLVTRIRYDMTIRSSFPETTYSSYEQYFEDKYRLKALSVGQPMIEVRPLSSSMSFITPRTQSKMEKWKTKQDKEEYEVVLVPEFCRVWPVHGRYWLKALLLPSALHRVTQLCAAEQMRATIQPHLQPDTGNTLAKLVEDMNICGREKKSERSQELQPVAMPSGEGVPSKPWGREEEPPEPDRCLLEVNEFDLAFYHSFVSKPLWSTNAVVCESGGEPLPVPVPTERDGGDGSGPLPMLCPHPLGPHPQQTTILQALMPDCANDLCNNKRLEILGDAFIKLALSLGLFRFEKGLKFRDELASVRSTLAHTKNLFNCGEFRKSNMLLDIQEFSPAEEWVPPGFCVDSRVAAVITLANLSPHSLFDIMIPDEERRSGVISDVTRSSIEDILLNADDATCIHTNAFLHQQAVSEGQAAAAVRAIVAAHLQDGGIPAALTTMHWFQVARKELIPHDLFEFTEPNVQVLPDPKMFLWNYDWIQTVFHYKFSCLGHLLEAVTHPSYTLNNVTDCYSRLDFLGEAVIDFAVTAYLHKQCTSLSAEEARSVRWALTDNVCAAALAVRHRLHTCLHGWSLPLARQAAKFAAYQCNRKHVIDSDLFLLTEDEDFDLNCCEVADVPSPLGSMFKSIVGAIFIDCGNDIDTVWKSLYPLIKDNIENLIKNVPKTHLRRLQDLGGCRFVEEDKQFSNLRHMARLEAYLNYVPDEFIGYGPTKEKAQQAAAKMAVRKIRGLLLN